jgi:hypothetical protein
MEQFVMVGLLPLLFCPFLITCSFGAVGGASDMYVVGSRSFGLTNFLR